MCLSGVVYLGNQFPWNGEEVLIPSGTQLIHILTHNNWNMIESHFDSNNPKEMIYMIYMISSPTLKGADLFTEEETWNEQLCSFMEGWKSGDLGSDTLQYLYCL